MFKMIKRPKRPRYSTDEEKEKFYAAIDAIRQARIPKAKPRHVLLPNAEREAQMVM